MSTYVISITPDDDEVAGIDTPYTTVRVDTSTGQTLIQEVNIRAGNGGGLTPSDLPRVDLDLLIRALTAPATSPALPSRADDASPTESAELADEAEAELVAPEEGTERVPARTSRARGAGRRSSRGGAAKKASARKGAAASKQQPRKRAAAKSTRRRSRATESDKRPYRRMPDASEVMAAYEQVGTISGLAEHYDVPRHTVAAWARRLRSEGYAIGRQ